MNRGNRFLRIAFLWLVCLAGLPSWGQPLAAIDTTKIPAHSLGLRTQVLAEDGAALSIDQARTLFAQGKGEPGHDTILSFGIGAAPRWVRLALHNPGTEPQRLHLMAGIAWLNWVDVYLLGPGPEPLLAWQSGDERIPAPGLTAGLGFQLPMDVPAGDSELYVRVQSIDAMLIPIELLTAEALATQEREVHYGYGIFTGVVVALMVYFAMLYLGVRRRSDLMYCLYLGALLLLNLGYTGHGIAYLWPEQLWVQRHGIFASMVLYAMLGLVFADSFLALHKHAPRLHLAIWRGGALALGLAVVLALLDSHLGSAVLGFVAVLVFIPTMVLLGSVAVRRRVVGGRYFLAAAVSGMLGSLVTALSVLGWIPYSSLAFHGLEIGFAIDATLLALALAYQMRQQLRVSAQAEFLANHDPLTELRNRRGFLEHAHATYSLAERSGRPISVVILDLDHFKRTNDTYGHSAGDQVLVTCARILSNTARAADLVARWGGEEFVLLLPDTDLPQACALAERLRTAFAAHRFSGNLVPMRLSASFGVAQRQDGKSLEDLIKLADRALYRAKAAGRDRVQVADPMSDAQSPLFQSH
jgi:two-component system, sensor histidine kinase LadS